MDGENILEMLANDILELEELTDGRNGYQRFPSVDDADTEAFIAENKNKNTNSKTRTVRKQDGSDYEPDSITSIQNSIDRHLRDRRITYSIKRDPAFSHSNRVLESKRKSLKAQGKGNKRLKADPLSSEEVNILRSKKLIGYDTPESLLHAVWINNALYFGFRGRQDHVNLLWGDVELKETSDGREYLEFNERSTKTRSGARASDYRAVAPKMFAQDDHNCPVKLYKFYKEHRPEGARAPESRFYLRPLARPTGDAWFSNQPVGKNKLGNMMNVLAEKGELKGRKTNHSTRKSFATTLVQAGRAPTEVAKLAGWKNVQTVNEYSNPSVTQQEETSNLIGEMMGNKRAASPSVTEESEVNNQQLSKSSIDISVTDVTNPQLSSMNSYCLNPYTIFAGATVSGSSINVNIYPGKDKSDY